MTPCSDIQIETNMTADCFTSNMTYINGSDFFCHEFIYDVVRNGMYVKYAIIGVVFLVAALIYCPICCIYWCAQRG